MSAIEVSETKVFRASWIAPMDRPRMENAALCVAGGRILNVLPSVEAARRYPGVETIDLGDVVLLPGLVNPHVHLELSDLSPGDPPASLADWIIALIQRMPNRDEETVT